MDALAMTTVKVENRDVALRLKAFGASYPPNLFEEADLRSKVLEVQSGDSKV